MISPYIGLNYFNEGDASLFFGRDAERTRLIGNLRASRLTLLYAQSGVGKSSLLRAGVAARLREITRARRQTRTPLYVPVVFSAWHGDPLAALIDEIELAMRDVAPDLELPRHSLQAALEHATEEARATPLVMFDQFEEYFLYHPEDGDDSFADEIAACVTTRDLPAHFLISIREDAYSRIGDRFSTRIPHVFANYLHLDYLDEGSARKAITGPLDQLNAHRNGSPELSIEYELVDEVLRQVRRPPSEEGGEDRFETPYLQLVMERLWNEDGPSGNLRLATLDRLGGAAKIVRGHLEDAMVALPGDQRAAAAGALRFLVTSGGSKIALTAAELSELAGIPEADLVEPLEWLDRRRVLRRVASPDAGLRYELFHDVLGEPVIEWRKRYGQQVEADRQAAELRAEAAAEAARLEADEHRRLEEERVRHRAQLVLISGVLLGLLVCALGALVVVVLHQNGVAREQGDEARSHAVAAGAESQLDANPRLSALLAREAWKIHATPQAEEALRLSVSAFIGTRARDVLSISNDRLNAYADHAGRSVAIVTSPDSARIWDVEKGAWRPGPPLVHRGRIDSVVWSGDDSTMMIAGRGGAIVLRHGTKPLTLTERDVSSADLDFNGQAAAIATGHAAVVYDTRDGHRLAVERPGPRVHQVAFAPKTKGVLGIATCQDGNVRLWNWRTKRVHVLLTAKGRTTHPIHRGSTGSCMVAFSADGDYVATAVRTSGPRVWTFPRGRYVSEFYNFDPVRALAWSPRGHKLVVRTTYGVQAIGSLRERYPSSLDTSGSIDVSSRAPETATAATIGRDGRAAVGDEAGGIAVESLGRGTAPLILPGHTDRIITLQFLAGGRLMSVGADGTVRFWDVTPPKRLIRLAGSERLSAAAFRPDGRQLAVGTYDPDGTPNGSVRLADPADPKSARRVPRAATGSRRGADSWITDTKYLPDGRLLAVTTSGSARHDTVHILDPRTMASTFALTVPFAGQVRSAAVSGGALVLIRDQGPPTVLDMHTKRPVKLSWPSGVNARTLDLSPDGSRLLIGADDGRARIFSATTHKQIADVGKRGGAMSGAIFSPDAKQVLTYGGDRLAHLWRIADGNEVATLRGHAARIVSAAFNGRGDRIVTGDGDGVTRVWKLDGRKVTADRSHAESVVAVAFDPRDGTTILTASLDGAVTSIRCETCGSIESVERLAGDVKGKLSERETGEFLG